MSHPTSTAPAPADYARRVAKVRHDLRNPVAHILGFSEILVEKAREQGYNFLRGRIELIASLANEMLEQINLALDPEKLPAGRDARRLQQMLRKHSLRVASISDTLSRKPIVRLDASLSGDVDRIGGAARKLADVADATLGTLEPPDATGPAAHEPPPAAVPVKARPASPAKAIRILAAEEESEQREALGRILRQLGFDAELVRTRTEVLKHAGSTPADLILVDLTRPEPDGLQTLRMLRADLITREVPVLVVAGPEDLGRVIEALESGADDFVTKPFHPLILQIRIDGVLARRRTSGTEAGG